MPFIEEWLFKRSIRARVLPTVIGGTPMYLRASQLIFAATMIAIGITGLITGTFAPIWGGVPKALPDRQLLAYLSTLVSLACGAGLLSRRAANPAAIILLIYLIVWTALFKLPFIIRAPLVEVSYQSTGENLVLIAAAWVFYAQTSLRQAFPAGKLGFRTAYLLYGLALIAFGFSHFVYLNLTAPLVPAWLPKPVFWAYLTGGIYLATGIALITGFQARAGAICAALQIALITVLVWGPMLLRGKVDPGSFQESVVSWALTAGALVIAASFEKRAWNSADVEPVAQSAAAEVA